MLKNLIYEYFKKENEARTPQDSVTFAPSYFTSCKRQVFYKKTGTEVSNPIDEAAYFKMALGTASHEKIQSIISKLGILQECEDMKTIEWNGSTWNYRIDGIVEIDGKRYVLEIKTVYGTGFRYIEEKPKENDFMQIQLYMLFENIADGLILYVGRDNGFMIEHYVKSTPGVQEQLKNKGNELIKLKSMIENKQIPDRDFQIQLKNTGEKISEDFTKDKVKHKTAWQCSYCQWKDNCWQTELEEIKKHDFYIDGQFINK
jgi:hypothetical protein